MKGFNETEAVSSLVAKITKAAATVRQTKPLAPSITNTVTVNFVANAQLAAGGAAAMVYLADEGECMAQAAEAIYINMGTHFPFYAETLPRTTAKIKALGKKWVLDPVGLGIGGLRTQLTEGFRNTPPDIIRCNASEAIALAKLWKLDVAAAGVASSGPSGVESTDEVASAVPFAVALARFTHGAVAVSGKEDFVTDGEVGVWSSGGSPLMEKVTGSGCALGGVCAVYACVTDPFTAAVAATAHFNVAASRATAVCDAPGSFYVRFIDELYRATPQDIAANHLRAVNVAE